MTSDSSRRSIDRWSDRSVPVGLVVLVFILCVYPLMDTDFWWHLRTGQLIWERGAVPRTDWYLFTDHDRPWIDLHYGYQLMIAALYQAGGIDLIIVVKAMILATAVGFGWNSSGQNVPAWLKGLLWISPALCIACRGGERPEIISVLLLAIWLWIGQRAKRSQRVMWLLPLVQLVWINFHALFILGLIVGGCFAIDIVLRHFAKGRWGLEAIDSGFSIKTMFLVAAVSGLAVLVNPYFVQGVLFPLTLYRKFSVEQQFYSGRIIEFARPVYVFQRAGFPCFISMQK